MKCIELGRAKFQNFSCTLSTLGFLTLKPAAFEDVYLPPVASEASEGRMLNSNQLQNVKQLLNTKQKKLTIKLHLLIFYGQQKKFWTAAHLKCMHFKNLWRQ